MNVLEPQFAELADSMADLEANFMHLQLMHESVARFSECFASFLYGLNMNAFCVDFPEVKLDLSERSKDALLRIIGSDSWIVSKSQAGRYEKTYILSSSKPLITAANNWPETTVGPDRLNNDAEATFLWVVIYSFEDKKYRDWL